MLPIIENWEIYTLYLSTAIKVQNIMYISPSFRLLYSFTQLQDTFENVF